MFETQYGLTIVIGSLTGFSTKVLDHITIHPSTVYIVCPCMVAGCAYLQQLLGERHSG